MCNKAGLRASQPVHSSGRGSSKTEIQKRGECRSSICIAGNSSSFRCRGSGAADEAQVQVARPRAQLHNSTPATRCPSLVLDRGGRAPAMRGQPQPPLPTVVSPHTARNHQPTSPCPPPPADSMLRAGHQAATSSAAPPIGQCCKSREAVQPMQAHEGPTGMLTATPQVMHCFRRNRAMTSMALPVHQRLTSNRPATRQTRLPSSSPCAVPEAAAGRTHWAPPQRRI